MSTDIAALIGSRICHDLISPIGAIGNGMELLSLTQTGTDTGPELSLVTESVDNANARIKFFRIAFGAGSGEHAIGNREMRQILGAIGRGGRLTYDWQVEHDQPRHTVRVALLMLLCFETAMPLGGEITIRSDSTTWTLTGIGKRIHVDPDLWHGLDGTASNHDFTPAQVQFAMLPDAMKNIGLTPNLAHTENEIIVRF